MSEYIRQEVQPQPWSNPSPSITSAQSALTTDKSSATVHALAAAKVARITPDEGTVAIELRFRFDGAAGQTNIFNMYAQCDPSQAGDHYRLIATITVESGTQVDANGYFFGDNVSLSAEKWIDDIEDLSATDDDDIGSVALNVHGYTDFVLIATTLGSTAAYVDWRQE